VAQDHTYLVLDAQISEYEVQSLATNHAVGIGVIAPIANGRQMLDARLSLWNSLVAEEATLTLKEKKSLELRHGSFFFQRGKIVIPATILFASCLWSNESKWRSSFMSTYQHESFLRICERFQQ